MLCSQALVAGDVRGEDRVVGKLWADFIKQLPHDLGLMELANRLASGMQIAAPRECHERLDETPDLFALCHGRRDTPVLDEPRRQIAQCGLAMGGVPA